MIEFSNVTRVTDKPSIVSDLSPGNLSGGALVPGDTCVCNCGLIAELNFGAISIEYDDGIRTISRGYDYRSGFDWIDSGPLPIYESGVLASGGNVGVDLYVAFAWWTSPEAGCLPECLLLVDDPDALDPNESLRRIRVNASGVGELVTSQLEGGGGGGGREDGFSLFRDGVKYGNLSGFYGDENGGSTIPPQVFVAWRRYTGFPA